MAAEIPGYRTLPGKARRRMGIFDGTRGRLFLGKDHVLHVQSGQYSESSRRFYLKDIQALTLRPSRERGWATAGLLVLTLLLFLPAILAVFLEDDGARLPLMVLGFVLAAIPAVFLVFNFTLGPRCHFCLHTAAHVEELYGQSRLKTAHEVSAILAAAIRAAQQPVAPEGLSPGTAPGARAWNPAPDETSR